jgi:hypothetical protein
MASLLIVAVGVIERVVIDGNSMTPKRPLILLCVGAENE